MSNSYNQRSKIHYMQSKIQNQAKAYLYSKLGNQTQKTNLNELGL